MVKFDHRSAFAALRDTPPEPGAGSGGRRAGPSHSMRPSHCAQGGRASHSHGESESESRAAGPGPGDSGLITVMVASGPGSGASSDIILQSTLVFQVDRHAGGDSARRRETHCRNCCREAIRPLQILIRILQLRRTITAAATPCGRLTVTVRVTVTAGFTECGARAADSERRPAGTCQWHGHESACAESHPKYGPASEM